MTKTISFCDVPKTDKILEKVIKFQVNIISLLGVMTFLCDRPSPGPDKLYNSTAFSPLHDKHGDTDEKFSYRFLVELMNRIS